MSLGRRRESRQSLIGVFAVTNRNHQYKQDLVLSVHNGAVIPHPVTPFAGMVSGEAFAFYSGVAGAFQILVQPVEKQFLNGIIQLG